MSLILPSYQSGFAPRDYEPAYPSLWRGCVAAYAPLLGPTGLVLRDAVGKNDGVLTNGPTWQISGGKYALDFDGTNDYVALADVNQLRILSGTICGWFRSAPLGAGVYKCIVANYAQSASVVSGWSIGINIAATGTDKLGIVIGNNTGQSTANVNQVYTTNTVTDSVLHHFAFNITATGDVKIYLDGKDAGATRAFGTQVPIVYASTSYVSIGAEQTGPTYGTGKYWPNILDDIRIYNRLLSESEIRLLASRRGIGYDFKSHRSYSKTQSSGLRKKILTGLP